MILINFHKNKTHAAIDNVRLMEIDKAVRRLRTISLDFRLTMELVFYMERAVMQTLMFTIACGFCGVRTSTLFK